MFKNTGSLRSLGKSALKSYFFSSESAKLIVILYRGRGGYCPLEQQKMVGTGIFSWETAAQLGYTSKHRLHLEGTW